MSDEHQICELKIELAKVKVELKATADALVLARDNRHFMWALMLNFVIGVAAFAVALLRH